MARNPPRFRATNFSGGARVPKADHSMASAFEFIQAVRAEAAKVTWPTRRETLITTGLVIVMVFVASLFFVTVDQGLRLAIGLILGLGHKAGVVP